MRLTISLAEIAGGGTTYKAVFFFFLGISSNFFGLVTTGSAHTITARSAIPPRREPRGQEVKQFLVSSKFMWENAYYI